MPCRIPYHLFFRYQLQRRATAPHAELEIVTKPSHETDM
jgi:hypothetical protein